jgi:N-methylhydantoinase A/oxoprolinase/acetone carboxylase beta subunit
MRPSRNLGGTFTDFVLFDDEALNEITGVMKDPRQVSRVSESVVGRLKSVSKRHIRSLQ